MPVTAGDGTWTALINALGTNPALLLLALVLAAGTYISYKLINKFLDGFLDNSKKMADSVEKMANDFSSMKDDVHELKKDMAVIAERVSGHEIRLNRLEDNR